MEKVWLLSALWIGLALCASLISIWSAISVALIEIMIGAVAGNIIGLPLTPWIDYLAGFGAILLTFLAGTEVDADVVRRNFGASIGIGIVSFLAPYLGCLLAARYGLGWSWPQAQIAGIALSTTSVAVVYAVMVETGLNKTELGKIILAACFVTDLGTVLALGVVFANFSVWLLAFAAATAVATRAQQGERMRRIGVLRFTTQDQAVINSLLRGLQTLGYVDGKNVAIEYRDAEGNYERFSKAVDELVRLNPDVIFSFGGEQAPVVKAATSSIPIVVVVSNDPVESGLVASLARPGGNITGVTYVHDMLAGKSVELLKDTAPWVSRVAILWNPGHVDPEFRETQRASRALDVQLQSLEVRAPSDFDGAFQAAARERAEALIVIGSRVMFLNRQRIGQFAATTRLILVGVPRWLIDVGAVLTFGPNVAELHQRASVYLHKILKCAKPADLPMQQPTTFELTINLKVAKSLGLIVPPTVIARADEVIE